MALNAVHTTLDEIPENFRELYTEKNGKFELTGISGVKTQADIDRLQVAIAKERDATKAEKEKLSVWGDYQFDDVVAKLDKYPELEAAAAGKLDEASIEEIVSKRVDGTINSKTAPLERQLKLLQTEREELAKERDALSTEKRQRLIHDSVRKAMTASKVIPEAQEDALMLAERVFEIREDDGQIVTRDQVGVTPGIAADVWLTEMVSQRPHWWPATQGGGARGGSGGGASFGGSNPWALDSWNMTKQGQVLNEHGREKADQMAASAGTTVGGLRPKPKK